jgi:hypothetical protein
MPSAVCLCLTSVVFHCISQMTASPDFQMASWKCFWLLHVMAIKCGVAVFICHMKRVRWKVCSVLGLYFELRKPELQMYLVEKHRKEGQKWNDNCEMDVVHVAVKSVFLQGFIIVLVNKKLVVLLIACIQYNLFLSSITCTVITRPKWNTVNPHCPPSSFVIFFAIATYRY